VRVDYHEYAKMNHDFPLFSHTRGTQGPTGNRAHHPRLISRFRVRSVHIAKRVPTTESAGISSNGILTVAFPVGNAHGVVFFKTIDLVQHVHGCSLRGLFAQFPA
jgi:hypothetical protein